LCGAWGIGSAGISEFIELGAPEMTTRGGAGDVLSETGDRRGVMGAPPACEFNDEPSDRGEGPPVRFKGELDMGEDGPGEEEDGMAAVSLLGALGDFDLPSPDFVLERF